MEPSVVAFTQASLSSVGVRRHFTLSKPDILRVSSQKRARRTHTPLCRSSSDRESDLTLSDSKSLAPFPVARRAFVATSLALLQAALSPGIANAFKPAALSEERLQEYYDVISDSRQGIKALRTNLDQSQWNVIRELLRVYPLGNLRQAMFKVSTTLTGKETVAAASYKSFIGKVEQLDALALLASREMNDTPENAKKAAGFLDELDASFTEFLAFLPKDRL
mmetsp:Transcript_36769/g.59418  ORF Transcript_36769/g.59418 Transcript_36769/m.59418 type:complete len:222 (+) Transcript_36769:152-817(+)